MVAKKKKSKKNDDTRELQIRGVPKSLVKQIDQQKRRYEEQMHCSISRNQFLLLILNYYIEKDFYEQQFEYAYVITHQLENKVDALTRAIQAQAKDYHDLLEFLLTE